jgi:hypothetical protein
MLLDSGGRVCQRATSLWRESYVNVRINIAAAAVVAAARKERS